MVVEVPIIAARHIAVVVHPFQGAGDHLAVEDLAADGNKKVYTLYCFSFDNVVIIIHESVGISFFNWASCG